MIVERGQALPQFYSDGDRCIWRNDMHWSWPFWYWLQSSCRRHPGVVNNDEAEMLFMGGEL